MSEQPPGGAGTRPDPLWILDLSQTRAAVVIAEVEPRHLHRPTPCDDWDVQDVINKLVASTRVFTAFGRREPPDPALDLVDPVDLIGDDPLGAYLEAAARCREAWRAPGALDGSAPSTIGEAPAKAVLHARIFDTTVLTWDIATAIGRPHRIDEVQAAYVTRIARALVPAVRARSEARYKPAVELPPGADPVAELIAITGRHPEWSPGPG